jgi:hypothetical protein
MPITDVVSLAISVQGAGPQQAGFGETLIAASNLWFSGGVREYSSVSGMITDGAGANHPAVLAATMIFSQNPAPPAVKVGPRNLKPAQTLKVTLNSTSTLDTYSFKVGLPGTTPATISFASTGVPGTDAGTAAAAVTALALTGVTATHTSSNAFFTISLTAGALVDFYPDLVHCSFADTTTDPGIATDLNAILALDANWYGLVLDSQSPAEITAAAAWAEANGKLFIWNTTDSLCMNPSDTTNIMYTEKLLSHTRSAGLMSASRLLSYSGAAWQGRLFPTIPGSENWAFKTLSGVIADPLTTTQIHAVEGFNGSVYSTIFGLNLTQFGKRPDGQWIDITRGIDALTNAIQVGILALLANNLKIPYTDAGVDMIRSVLTAALTQFVNTGFLAASPAPFVSVPLVANLSPTSRQSRNLPLVSFTAQLAGAIDSVTIQGVITN